MGQWITSPERIIQPFQTVSEVTWTFNLLEAMEFVGILCMSMWLTTFFFTPKIRKVTHMLVSFITVNNSSLKNQPNNGDLLTDIRTKTTWICAYVIWTPHQYFMELHSIGINYQIGPAIWIITTLSLFIFPRWKLSIYFDFNLNCPLYNSAVLSLCLCLCVSLSLSHLLLLEVIESVSTAFPRLFNIFVLRLKLWAYSLALWSKIDRIIQPYQRLHNFVFIGQIQRE